MSHEHNHTHSHNTQEESLALLAYMVDHNKHHAEELHEIAHGLSSDAAELIHEAIKDFNMGNDKLEKALNIAKGE